MQASALACGLIICIDVIICVSRPGILNHRNHCPLHGRLSRYPRYGSQRPFSRMSEASLGVQKSSNSFKPWLSGSLPSGLKSLKSVPLGTQDRRMYWPAGILMSDIPSGLYGKGAVSLRYGKRLTGFDVPPYGVAHSRDFGLNRHPRRPCLVRRISRHLRSRNTNRDLRCPWSERKLLVSFRDGDP